MGAYRLRQLWLALTAAPAAAHLAQARRQLSPPLLVLFERMSAGEQAHSLAVYNQLRQAGLHDPDLLSAALLHDCGKTLYPLRLWERVLIVLARVLFPAAVWRWGAGQPHGWRRAFVVARQHPAWGADLAARAGATAGTVALIRRHQDDAISGLPPALAACLVQLQQADNEN